MPHIELEPGEYRTRKPKGWRWRLPWSHPGDSKLHAVGMVAGLFGLAYVFVVRDELETTTLFVGTAIAGAIFGLMFALAFRED